MDTPNYLRFLTIASAMVHFLSSLILIWDHRLYTTFVLGIYGAAVSVGIILFEHYEKYYNYLVDQVPPLKKNMFKGVILIVFGSLYLGRETENMPIISGSFLIFCGVFHIVNHYVNKFFKKHYKEGVPIFERPAYPPENDRYDELAM